MPQFSYRAKTGPEAVTTGYIQADTVAQAVSKLVLAGQVPIEVKPFDGSAVNTPLFAARVLQKHSKIASPSILQFTRQLADLLNAGIPLLRCVEVFSRQRRYPAMAGIAKTMILSLKQGESLSFALSKYPDVFQPLYVNAVKAGEAGGQLPLVLERLAQFLEQDMEFKSKVKASLLYPGIILAVGCVSIFVLLSFVLPKLTVMFEDFDTELPLLTRMVVGVSYVFGHYWWCMAGFIAAAAFAIRKFLRTPAGKVFLDGQVLKIPVLKGFIEDTQLARFARTLGMLIESGVPVVTALELVTSVVDNTVLQKEVRSLAVKVRGGMSLTQAVKSSAFFPEIAADLITVGQESGRLERGLYKLAEGCERSSRDMAQVFVTILGPAVLIIVVAIVGVMLVSMLMPMFQMNMLVK